MERLKKAISENWKTWRESKNLEDLHPEDHDEYIQGTEAESRISKEPDPAEQGESREGTLSQESNTDERKLNTKESAPEEQGESRENQLKGAQPVKKTLDKQKTAEQEEFPEYKPDFDLDEGRGGFCTDCAYTPPHMSTCKIRSEDKNAERNQKMRK